VIRFYTRQLPESRRLPCVRKFAVSNTRQRSGLPCTRLKHTANARHTVYLVFAVCCSRQTPGTRQPQNFNVSNLRQKQGTRQKLTPHERQPPAVNVCRVRPLGTRQSLVCRVLVADTRQTQTLPCAKCATHGEQFVFFFFRFCPPSFFLSTHSPFVTPYSNFIKFETCLLYFCS